MFIEFNTEFWKTIWRIRSIIAFLLLIIICGAFLIASHEQLPFSEALYFSFITGLTIGYGDIVATSTIGRVTSILLGITGILFTGMVVAAAVYALQKTVQHTYGSE
ncbi:MAG: potassium channel family protein [Gammaproteobacteria bacterium]|nr:potassium channel family protein [Gammaproteobacteria bacterium]